MERGVENQLPVKPAMKQDRRWSALGMAFGAFILVFFLWQFGDQSNILYPLRLLVTFVHETGHGLTALLTGGRFLRFVVYPDGSGVATTAGGSPFLVPQMGYLGAALFGAVLLFAANHVQRTKIVAGALGVFFTGCALLYTEAGPVAMLGPVVALGLWLFADFQSQQIPTGDSRSVRALRILALLIILGTLVVLSSNVALVIGLIAGSAFFALAAFASPPVTRFALDAVAFVTGFNVFSDLQFLLSNQSVGVFGTPNDALAMAVYTHTPVTLWIVVWILIALAMMGAVIYLAFIRQRQ